METGTRAKRIAAGRLRSAKYGHKIMAMPKKTKAVWATVGSAEFKSRCLELVNHVREARAEYVVTRHGEPMAKLVPVDSAAAETIFGCMKGSMTYDDRVLEPVPGAYTYDAPNLDLPPVASRARRRR